MANKDLSLYTFAGNSGGLVFQLDDGSLLRCGDSSGATKGIRKSTDGGKTWTLNYTFTSSSMDARGHFIDSRGWIWAGTISQITYGQWIVSKDNGETWTVDLTSEASGFWYMCEDSAGNLYTNEYSIGNRDADELYAYNIWKLAPGGSWTKFYTAPAQSTPGAKDGIRHIHNVFCDSHDNLYTGFGDPTFASPAQNFYRLNANGTLGTLISTDDNGVTAFVEADNGSVLFGGDNSPVKIKKYNPDTGDISTALNIQSAFGSYYDTAVLDMCKGRDGVIYALTNGVGGSKPSVIIASADDGETWDMIRYTRDLIGASYITTNPRVSNGRVYIGRAQNSSTPWMDIPDYTRGEIASNRMVVR